MFGKTIVIVSANHDTSEYERYQNITITLVLGDQKPLDVATNEFYYGIEEIFRNLGYEVSFVDAKLVRVPKAVR